MFKKNLIIVIIISLIIGFGAGYVLELVQLIPKKTTEDVIILKNSKMFTYWNTTVSGNITEISNRTLTLSSDGEILSTSIQEDALVSRFVIDEKTREAEQQGMKFEELKVGDTVDVIIRLKIDGEFEGLNVTVYP